MEQKPPTKTSTKDRLFAITYSHLQQPSVPKPEMSGLSKLPLLEAIKYKVEMMGIEGERLPLNEYQRQYIDRMLYRDNETLQALITELSQRMQLTDPNTATVQEKEVARVARNHWENAQMALRHLGVRFDDTDPNKIISLDVNSDQISEQERQIVKQRRKELSVFPKEQPLPIADIFRSIKIVEHRVGPHNEPQQFAVLEVYSGDARKIALSEKASGRQIRMAKALEDLMDMRHNFRSHYTKETKMKVVVPVRANPHNPNKFKFAEPGKNGRQGVPEGDFFHTFLNYRLDTHYNPVIRQKLVSAAGITREELKNYAVKGGRNPLEEIIGELGIRDQLAKAPKKFVKNHGWTGSGRSTEQPAFFQDLSACGEGTIGILPYHLGYDHTLSDITFGVKIPPEDKNEYKEKVVTNSEYGITPRLHGDQILMTLDELGMWDKRTLLNCHSHAGAGGYYTVSEIIARSDREFERLQKESLTSITRPEELDPEIFALIDAPALKGTNTFRLNNFDRTLQDFLMFAHKTKLTTYAPLITELSTRLFAWKVAPREHSRATRKEHALTAADPIDFPAVDLSVTGLDTQADLPPIVIDRANSGRVLMVANRAEDDLITNAANQAEKFKSYRLTHMDIFFKDSDIPNQYRDGAGHFTHNAPVYKQVFHPLMYMAMNGPLNVAKEFVGSLKQVLPIGNLSGAFDRRQNRLTGIGEKFLPPGARIDRGIPWTLGGYEDMSSDIDRLLNKRWIEISPLFDQNALKILKAWTLNELFRRGAFPAVSESDLGKLEHPFFAGETPVYKPLTTRTTLLRIATAVKGR